MNAPHTVVQLAARHTRLQPRNRDQANDDDIHDRHGARVEIIAGLCAQPASIAPKYFYDQRGCRLFELITGLPEYYPTRTERNIMQAHAAEIATEIGTQGSLIYLGAGNCSKARALFPTLKPRQYVAVDFSTGFVRDVLTGLQGEFPHIDMYALGADFSRDEWCLPPEIRKEPRVFFYPGSSIGNFEREAALLLLRRVAEQCVQPGGLLIGVDLVKNPATLEAAYNDTLGVTAAFNLNVLNHVNEVAGCNFNVQQWRHLAFYNSHAARIEMHLQTLQDCVVRWPDDGAMPAGERWFAAGERIHTENSYKYTVEGFEALLREAGFGHTRVWLDPDNAFGVFYASR